MSEFSIIRRLIQMSGPMPGDVVAGPGDDCAVVSTGGPRGRLVLTTDAMVEGVHFVKDSLSPGQLGRRAISVALSDIAAMGGSPSWALVSCGLDPEAWPEERALSLLGGMKNRLEEFGAAIIGGNLTRSERLFVSVTAGGYCPGHPMMRSGARPGDLLVVTGELGGAALGIDLVRAGAFRPDHPLVARHADPPARIREGMMLRHLARACIDVSDGLLQDLGHLLEASGVGAVVEAAALPLAAAGSPEFSHERRLRAALAGGEDYELLAAVPPGEDDGIAGIEEATGTTLTVIGRLTERRGTLEVLDASGKPMDLPERLGWDHFRGEP